MALPAPLGALLHWLVRTLPGTRPMRQMSWRRRLATVVFAFPVLMSLAALLFGLEAAVYVLRSERVMGVVVERYEWPGETIFDRGEINYEPIFTYEMNGESYRASVGSGHPSFALDIGESAAIRAIPGARGNVRLDTWQGLWFMPVMLGLFAAAGWAVGGIAWWVIGRIFWREDAG